MAVESHAPPIGELPTTTEPQSDDAPIDDLLDQLFRSAGEEWYEHAIESNFARDIGRAIETYHEDALRKVGARLTSPQTEPHVAAEVAVVLGRLRDEGSHEERRGWLEAALASPSHHVRDAAGLALSSMDDPQSLPAVERAIAREPFASLKADLQGVADQLREHLGAR